MSDSIQRLYDAVTRAREGDAPSSRTAKLMREGTTKIAKKLAEEAVEVGHEAILRDRQKTVEESADVLYNLAVLWADAGIQPQEVYAEMDRREEMMGIAEKLPKSSSVLPATKSRRREKTKGSKAKSAEGKPAGAPTQAPVAFWSWRGLARRLGIGHN